MQDYVDTVFINKQEYHPYVIFPRKHEVVKVNTNKWKGKAIRSILTSYTDMFEHAPYYFTKVLIGRIPDIRGLIDKIYNNTWGFARKVARNTDDFIPKPDISAERVHSHNLIVRQEIQYSKRMFGHYTTKFEFKYHPVGVIFKQDNWKYPAAQEVLGVPIHSVSLNMPYHQRFVMYSTDGTNMRDKLRDIEEDTWKFAKMVCNEGFDSAKEWRKEKDLIKSRRKEKADKLRKQAEERDAIVHCVPKTSRKYGIWGRAYYKGMIIGSFPTQGRDYFTLTKTYYGNPSIGMRYSVYEFLKDINWYENSDLLNSLADNQDKVESGDIDYDDIMAIKATI